MEKNISEPISSELARVHARLCGDGYVYFSKTKEKDRNFTAVIGYCNNNQRLLDKFREDFNKLFGVKMKMRFKREVSIRSIRLYQELKMKFGEFGSKEWRIHDTIKESQKEIKIEWLKAFFEDEAYNEKKYNRLKLKSMNFNGLKDIKELLFSIGIESSLTGPNCDKSYYLTISNFNSINEFNNFVKEPARR